MLAFQSRIPNPRPPFKKTACRTRRRVAVITLSRDDNDRGDATPPLPEPSPSSPPPPSSPIRSISWNWKGFVYFPVSLYAKFVKSTLPPVGRTLTKPEEACDPGERFCKTPLHVWEEKCRVCYGTGIARSSSSRGRGGRRQMGTCMICHGIGYIRHVSSNEIPDIDNYNSDNTNNSSDSDTKTTAPPPPPLNTITTTTPASNRKTTLARQNDLYGLDESDSSNSSDSKDKTRYRFPRGRQKKPE